MNGTAQDQITAYVEAVRAALADIPTATREELLDDLPEHLTEVLAESTGPETLTDRLGPPERYAAELRAAAGFVGGFPDPPPPTDRLAEWRTAVLRDLRTFDRHIGPAFGHTRATEFFALLRPAWWVLRGYLAAMLLAYVLDDSGQPIGLLPRIGGSELVALLLLGGAVLGSIWIGRRTARLAPWPRYALRAGTLMLVLVGITGFFDADSNTRGSQYADVHYDNPYSNVQDVFVYDEQGRMLTGARLFDQNGEPIRLGWRDCEPPLDAAGNPIELVYPYCPENAPFLVPSAPATAPVPPTPSDTSTPSAPAPSTARSSSSAPPSAAPVEPSGSASGAPSPSPSVSR